MSCRDALFVELNILNRVRLLRILVVFIIVFLLIEYLSNIYTYAAKYLSFLDYNRAIESILGEIRNSKVIQTAISLFSSVCVGATVEYIRDKPVEITRMDEQWEPESSDKSSGMRGHKTSEFVYLKRVQNKYDSLKDKHTELRKIHSTNARKLFKAQQFARRHFRFSLLLSVAIFTTLALLIAAISQYLVDFYYTNPQQLDEPLRFFITFTHTEVLFVSALIMPFVLYRKYLRVVRYPDFKSCFTVGFLGVILPSVIILVAEIRESGFTQGEKITNIAYLEIPDFQFFLLTQLLLFPIFGFIACCVAAVDCRERKKINK